MTPVSPALRRNLLGEVTSRQNKLWIMAGLLRDGFFVEWEWTGKEYHSRLRIAFEPSGPFRDARSYDDDVRPFLKFGKDDR